MYLIWFNSLLFLIQYRLIRNEFLTSALCTQRDGILRVATKHYTRDYTAKQLQPSRYFTYIPIWNSTVHVHVEWFSSRLSARRRLTKNITRTMIRNFVLHRLVTHRWTRCNAAKIEFVRTQWTTRNEFANCSMLLGIILWVMT